MTTTNEIRFGADGILRLTTGPGELLATTTDSWRHAWVARLIRARGMNPLNLRYFRKFLRPHALVGVERQFRIPDGVFEAESCGPGGEPRLFAFQVRGGKVTWTHIVTLDKPGAMARIDKALVELG